MNDGLLDAFRHNAWATREVLASCRGLTETELHATAAGVYGSLLATLRHLVSSEAGYCRRLTGDEPPWYQHTQNSPSLAALAEYADDLAARWERFLAQPFDAERSFVIPWHDGGERDVPAGVYLAQALHHGTEHRAHICTVLTTLGVEPPGVGLWEFAEATNRARPRAT